MRLLCCLLQEYGGGFRLVWFGGDDVVELGECKTHSSREGRICSLCLYTPVCIVHVGLHCICHINAVLEVFIVIRVYNVCLGCVQNCNFRTAAYLIAIERIATCYRVSGIFP